MIIDRVRHSDNFFRIEGPVACKYIFSDFFRDGNDLGHAFEQEIVQQFSPDVSCSGEAMNMGDDYGGSRPAGSDSTVENGLMAVAVENVYVVLAEKISKGGYQRRLKAADLGTVGEKGYILLAVFSGIAFAGGEVHKEKAELIGRQIAHGVRDGGSGPFRSWKQQCQIDLRVFH